MDEKEKWAQCHISENYEVSSIGRVRRKSTGRILKQSTDNIGYKRVTIKSSSGRHKNVKVHRLVMFAFGCSGYFERAEVNHLNGVKTDNRLSNLEWCTHKENLAHAKDKGLLRPRRGERHGHSKLTDDEILEIRRLSSEGMTQREIAKRFSVSQPSIHYIVSKSHWKHI